MEILLLHPGGLGDIILSLPAIALLRSVLPSARLTIAGNVDHLAPIISGYAERVVSLSTLPLHRLYVGEELPREDVAFWRSFGKIVSWTGSADPEFAEKLRKIHPDVCVARWRPDPKEDRHVSRLFVDSLGLGFPPEKSVSPARILLDPATRKEGHQWLLEHGWNGRDSLIALHPGAGSESKRWPLLRFVGLARHLALQKDRKLLIIEGPAERGLAAQIGQALAESRAIPVESVNSDLLAAVIEQCGTFIGNDSGVAHLAAALEVACILLFGPTLPQHWAPLGENVVVLRNTHGCEACRTGRGAHNCLGNISIDEVLQVLHQ